MRQELAWGMLTGVGTDKLVMQKLEAGLDQVQIRKFLDGRSTVLQRKGRTCL